jgi:hypothetical protein
MYELQENKGTETEDIMYMLFHFEEWQHSWLKQNIEVKQICS